MSANPFVVDGWKEFWERIFYELASREKFFAFYGDPCNCGSSVCDECNLDWGMLDPRDEEPWIDDYPDYDF